jgi:hypothetical protein
LSVYYSFPLSLVVVTNHSPPPFPTSKTNITTNFPTTIIAYTLPLFREMKQSQWTATSSVYLASSDIWITIYF